MKNLQLVSASILTVFAMIILTLGAAHRVDAQDVPRWINYQGRLTGVDGVAVADASWPVTFRLYDVPVGGDHLWSESKSVPTRNGLFATTLGTTSNFSASIFAKPLWLETEVNGRKLVPRQALGSVPFAMTALSVPGGAVSTVMLADYSVTSAKLADAAVTDSKLASGISGAKLKDASIDASKLAIDVCYAYNSASQVVQSNAWTTLIFDQERYDTNSLHNNTLNRNRITVQRAGLYRVTARTHFGVGSGSGLFAVRLMKNGIQVATGEWKHLSATTGNGLVLFASEPAVAGDYFELSVYQSSGSDLQCGGGYLDTYLNVEMIRALP